MDSPTHLILAEFILIAQIASLEAWSNDSFMCKDSDDYWPQEDFNLRACAACYGYLFTDIERVRYEEGKLYFYNDTTTRQNLVPDVHDEIWSERVCETLREEDKCNRWRQCCLSAELCCHRQLQQQRERHKDVTENGGELAEVAGHCGMTWDGYACWEQTPAGSELTLPCPTFIPYAMPSVDVYKVCTHNSTWEYHPGTTIEWTNYTTCLDLEHFKKECYISIGANSASILLLVPALTIFLWYRSLRKQHRIRLHIQLFMSFLLNCVVNILWEVLVVYDRMTNKSTETRMYQNTVGCKLLYVLTRYTRGGNYLWMFFEGFYLHRLIVKAFQPPKSLMPFYILGWGFPWLPVSLYAGLKSAYADESCWIKNYGNLEWLIYIPNLVSLVANLFFLGDILRILLTQLQSHPNEPSNYRRAIKATGILIPLFGLQLFAVIYRPPPTASGARQYEQIAAFITSSQGFFVALILCFLNGEVIGHLKACRILEPSFKAPKLRKQSMHTGVTECCTGNSFQNKPFLFNSQSAAANQRVPMKDTEQTYIAMKAASNGGFNA